MPIDLSPRLAAAVAALPLKPGLRVLEIGCGPGPAARAVAERIAPGYILGIDRSPTAIAQAITGCKSQIAAGHLAFRVAKVEDFELAPGEEPFDLAFALRVGALDGRHPELERAALQKIRRALRGGGRLFIDGGNPLRELELR